MVERKDSDNVVEKMSRLELRWSKIKSIKRFMDVVGGDMRVVGVTEKNAEYRVGWRWIISCGDR